MTCGQGGVLASACYTARTILKSAAIQPESAPPTAEVSIVTVLATVLWLGCLLVGGLGFVLPYARPRPIAPPAPGEVRVAVKAIGLNFADLFACLGLYSATPQGSFIPGLEFEIGRAHV